MNQTIDFAELTWNQRGISLPSSNTTYALAHLQITPEESDDGDPDTKLYAISISRTKEIVCNVKVKPAELGLFRMLQNMLLKSRL